MNPPIPSKIKELISESRTSDALAILLDASLPNKQVHAAIQTVLGEFNDLTAQQLLGTIEDTEAAKRLNHIHDKMLLALNAFDSEGKPLPDAVIAGSGPSGKFLSRVGLLLFSGSILLVLLGFIMKIMSLEGVSQVIIAGFCMGMGGLLVLGYWLFTRLMTHKEYI